METNLPLALSLSFFFILMHLSSLFIKLLKVFIVLFCSVYGSVSVLQTCLSIHIHTFNDWQVLVIVVDPVSIISNIVSSYIYWRSKPTLTQFACSHLIWIYGPSEMMKMTQFVMTKVNRLVILFVRYWATVAAANIATSFSLFLNCINIINSQEFVCSKTQKRNLTVRRRVWCVWQT